MSLSCRIIKKAFTFRFDARTSRGPMREKISWFMVVADSDSKKKGIGECGPLPGLSPENLNDIERILEKVSEKIKSVAELSYSDVFKLVASIVPPGFPSITFALETALLDLISGGKRQLFNNSFITGGPIPINGLIWMGDQEFMREQISKKINDGFNCIKLKIGGIDWIKECNLLRWIRDTYSSHINIRLDANGSFDEQEALRKLNQLATFNIHSIEQPVKPGSPGLAELCLSSPIPIALDEELIGQEQIKVELLSRTKPQFIILKPTLHGGLRHCQEWISTAEELNIGWWITSALESNIGLSAICQFAANYTLSIPQGLGTGSLYRENIPSPLEVKKGNIFYSSKAWDISSLE